MKYGALEYAYAAPIAAALASNLQFAQWLLNRTKFRSSGKCERVLWEEMKARRSKTAKDWWRSHFTEKCRCDGCRGHETDLLAIFQLDTNRRVAVHFEIKQPTDKFHPGQGRAYSLRAGCWVNNPPKAVLQHDDAATVLLCSHARLESYGAEASEFGSIITFEEIVSVFPGLIPPELAAGMGKSPAGGQVREVS